MDSLQELSKKIAKLNCKENVLIGSIRAKSMQNTELTKKKKELEEKIKELEEKIKSIKLEPVIKIVEVTVEKLIDDKDVCRRESLATANERKQAKKQADLDILETILENREKKIIEKESENADIVARKIYDISKLESEIIQKNQKFIKNTIKIKKEIQYVDRIIKVIDEEKTKKKEDEIKKLLEILEKEKNDIKNKQDALSQQERQLREMFIAIETAKK